LEKAVDHAALLVSDPSVIPRRELRLLTEASGPGDAGTVSRLVRDYSGRTGLRTFGVVCEEVNDRLLSLVKGLKDVEVVCITKRMISV
jgi:hypothetical protein